MFRRRWHHGSTSAADKHPAVPVSGIICANCLPLILGKCFSTIWRMQTFSSNLVPIND